MKWHLATKRSLGFCIVSCFSTLGHAQTATPALTPNQASISTYFKKACASLESDDASTLSTGEQDLLARCAFLSGPNSLSGPAYAALGGQVINALGPQTKKFGTLQQDNVAARLDEIRSGEVTASESGAAVAAATVDQQTSFFDGRLGLYANGSFRNGSKRQSKNSFAFNISDDSLTIGADYRLTSKFVVGAAYGTGLTSTEFAGSLGRLDLRAHGVDLYASLYGDSYYVDAVGGYGVPRLDTKRNVNYAEGAEGESIGQQALGTTHLHELWAGLDAGRPFTMGGFGLTPQGSINFHESRLSSFSETMSMPGAAGSGLGLSYGDAVLPSLQARLGVRTLYTWATPLGVFQPNLTASWIREFRNHPDQFRAQLTDAPAGDTDAAVIQTDPPEGHYTAYGGGIIFQLVHAVSGYVQYEELRTLKTIKSHEFLLGIRYQMGN